MAETTGSARTTEQSQLQPQTQTHPIDALSVLMDATRQERQGQGQQGDEQSSHGAYAACRNLCLLEVPSDVLRDLEHLGFERGYRREATFIEDLLIALVLQWRRAQP